MSTTITFLAQKKQCQRSVRDLPFQRMAEEVLGKHYELSLVFAGRARMTTLNRTYRKKTYVPNILSFPLDDTHGEIFINTNLPASEAREYNMSERSYIAYLFIHGLLHLKGMRHGATMESKERRLRRQFKIR